MMAWLKKAARVWLGINLQSEQLRLHRSYADSRFESVWESVRTVGAETAALNVWNRILEDNLHEANKASVKDRGDIETLRLWSQQQDAKLAEANAEIDRLRLLTMAEPAKKVFKPRTWRETSTLMEGNQ